jgi:hypothetical protein
MPHYQVNFTYVSAATVHVDADNKEEAEELAWLDVKQNGIRLSGWGDWTLDTVIFDPQKDPSDYE